jgi:hypothetical protein
MNWRSGLRVAAIALNSLFALWLFANAAAWGPDDYVGEAVISVPPILAVVALCVGSRRDVAKT